MTDRFLGKVIANKYKIERFLGESRLGLIYSGSHLQIGNRVTLEILDRKRHYEEIDAARFSSDARILSRLSHPNVLHLTDLGQDIDGTIYSVMEDSTGESLRERIDKEGQLSQPDAVQITVQVASALSACHAASLVHGRLNPEKVLLTEVEDGAEIVKLCGFAPSAVTNGKPSEYLDDAEFGYAAPEVCSGVTAPDQRSDVYSLGILFFELLAGERPFSADNREELCQKQIDLPPPPMSAFRNEIDGEVQSVLIRSLAKDPEKRFQSVADFAEALEQASGTSSPLASYAAAAGRIAGREEGNVWKTAFVVLAGISVLAFAFVYWTKENVNEVPVLLRTEGGNQPVQPINPATGFGERENLRNVSAEDPEVDPERLESQQQAGDGFDPWARPGQPPRGGRTGKPIEPGGDYVTVPENGSIFMPRSDTGVILVPKRVPGKTPAPSPSESPTTTPSSKPKATPEKKPPVVKPTPGKAKESGKTQNANKPGDDGNPGFRE